MEIFVVDECIDKGLTFLLEHQFPNGEFCCYIGHEDNLKDTIPYSTVFPTSLICYSLLGLSHLPSAMKILDLSATFLQFQCMRGGVWNNFTSWSQLFPVCPADVDNTSCASKVLQTLQRDFPPNTDILLSNRNKDGLFYTWYTLRPNTVHSKNYWMLILREYKNPLKSYFFWKKFECNRSDVDAVVNANVLFYLGLTPATQTIIPYLINIIKEKREESCDLWYRNPFTIYYFFSRLCSSGITEMMPVKDLIISRVVAAVNSDGSFGGSVLDTALGLIALIHLEYDSTIIENAVNFLIQAQHPSGYWQRWAVFYGGPKKLSCFGSEEMTTGFCLEALAMYRSRKRSA